MTKPVYVLGTGLSHDGSSCLLRDGELVVAVEKERLTRVKHDGHNDSCTLRYCLDAIGIDWPDVAVVVQNANFSMFGHGDRWFEGERIIPDGVRVVTISHHLAHAYSALGTCPFDRGAILVIDGCGNAFDEAIDREGATIPVTPQPGTEHLWYEKDSYYLFVGGKVRTVYKDFSPWGFGVRDYPMHPPTTRDSIGGMYAAASKYALFGMDDPGKLMGLAPYGRPGVFEGEIFELRDGRVFVRYERMREFERPTRSSADFKRSFQYYADLAYWIQREVERALLYVIQHRRQLAPAPNLVYAGGVALNAVANRRIVRECGFDDVYIQPAAGDNGLALGCAYYGWMEVLGRARVRHTGSTFLGRPYAEAEIDRALARRSSAIDIERTADFPARTAEILAAGKTVAWFVGGSEFGPRALGHRSILADPRRAEIRDTINSTIKLREDFRPFAPSVLREDRDTYFDCSYDSPYMLLVAPVRAEWRDKIPSVVHRDGSCRIQTVGPDSDPHYRALLVRFRALTGVSVVLNTSLNRRGMPIVETPSEAIEFFLSSALDALVFEGRVVTKRPVAAAEPFDVDAFLRSDRAARRLARAARDGGLPRGVFRLVIRGERSWTIDASGEVPILREECGAPASSSIEVDEADFPLLLGADSLRTLLYEERLDFTGDEDIAMALARAFSVEEDDG